MTLLAQAVCKLGFQVWLSTCQGALKLPSRRFQYGENGTCSELILHKLSGLWDRPQRAIKGTPNSLGQESNFQTLGETLAVEAAHRVGACAVQITTNGFAGTTLRYRTFREQGVLLTVHSKVSVAAWVLRSPSQSLHQGKLAA